MTVLTGELFGAGGPGDRGFFVSRAEKKTLDIRKRQVLWGEDEAPPAEINSFTQLLTNGHLWDDATIDLKDRYSFLWQEISERFETDELGERQVKTEHILLAHSAGMRLANEVLILLTHPNSDDPNEFGNLARSALSNQSLPHADSHTRPLEAIQTMNMILGGADVYDPSLTLVVAASFKPLFHDITQNVWEQLKEMHPEDEDLQKLDPKDDHKEAAAFLVHVLKPLIKKAGHLSDRLTEELVRVLAAGISVHDSLDDFQFRLSDKDKVSSAGLTDDQLFDHYQKGTVDQMTLTGLDRYRILKKQQEEIIKKKGLKNSVIFGDYGLGVSLEAAHRELITEAIDPNSQAVKGEISVDRELMMAWDSLFNLGDIWEMIIPGGQAVARKERVFRSSLRSLIFPSKDVSVAFSPVPLPNYDVSSWCRAMYEYRINLRVLKQSPFAKNRLFMEFLENTVMYNMIQAQKVYRGLVRGEEGLVELDNIQRERLFMLSQKALRKASVPEKARDMLLKRVRELKMEEVVHVIGENLLLAKQGKKEVELLTRFQDRAKFILQEFDLIRANLRKKPKPDGTSSDGAVYKYRDKDIEEFEQNFDKAWVFICEEIGIKDPSHQKHIREYMEVASPQRVALAYPMLPNPAFPDSLGKLEDAKTINSLPRDIKKGLNVNSGDFLEEL